MQLGFYFDQQRCIDCQTCVVACKQWHGIPPGPSSWRWVKTLEEGRYPNVWVARLSLSCCHCAKPACIPACPTSAIQKRAEDGIVVVDQTLCISGCRSCLIACPYEAPQFRNEKARMEMCDFCLDRIKEAKKPLCVVSCPVRGLDSGPLDDLRKNYEASSVAPGFADPSSTQPSIVFRPKNRETPASKVSK